VQNVKVFGAGDDWGYVADGISVGCRRSFVLDNEVFDATDGAIVIYGAPDTRVERNQIWASTRTLLGGINLVDRYSTYGGIDYYDYTNTTVTNNHVSACGRRVKIAFPMGFPIWYCGVYPNAFGAHVTNNTADGPDMGYGFAINGVENWEADGNTCQYPTSSGVPVSLCSGSNSPVPGAGNTIRPESRTGSPIPIVGRSAVFTA
jgi:hypothetical protein